METVSFDFRRLLLSKEELQSLPESKLNFLVAVSIAQNEINYHLRLLLASVPSSVDGGGTFREYCALHYLIASRRMAACAYEYIHLVQGYIGKLKTEEEVAADEVEFYRARLSDLYKNGCFDFAGKLRNKISNHYNQNYACENIRKFPENHEFSVILSQYVGNSMSPLGEEIGLFGFMAGGGEDPDFSPEQVDEWSKKCIRNLREVHDYFMVKLVKKFFADKYLTREVIEIRKDLTFSGREPFGFVFYRDP